MPKNVTIPLSIREKIIFVDTSAHYALIDESDNNFRTAKNFIEFAEKNYISFFTSNFVVAETHALILKKSALGYKVAKKFLEEMRRNNKLPERITTKDEERAFEIITKYSDKDFTCTDATSFALMERLGVTRVFTFDSHFSQYGFQKVP